MVDTASQGISRVPELATKSDPDRVAMAVHMSAGKFNVTLFGILMSHSALDSKRFFIITNGTSCE